MKLYESCSYENEVTCVDAQARWNDGDFHGGLTRHHTKSWVHMTSGLKLLDDVSRWCEGRLTIS